MTVVHYERWKGRSVCGALDYEVHKLTPWQERKRITRDLEKVTCTQCKRTSEHFQEMTIPLILRRSMKMIKKWKPKNNPIADAGIKESIRLINGVGEHRCRAKTGNWCLDCEIKHAKAQGIWFVLSMMEEAENEKDVCVRGKKS